MPKIKIIVEEGYNGLESTVNKWINDNFGDISEIYNIQIEFMNPGWYASISYEKNEGK